MSTHVTPQVGLVAIGSDGDWEVSITQSVSEPLQWFFNIDGASIYLNCEIESPSVVNQFLEVLTTPIDPDQTERRLLLGYTGITELELYRDNEFEDRCFINLNNLDAIFISMTIQGEDFTSLINATKAALQNMQS